MKAILVNDDKSLRWDNVPDPIIKSDEVLVKIEAAARSPRGSDSPPDRHSLPLGRSRAHYLRVIRPSGS